jgi:hypothetical protein
LSAFFDHLNGPRTVSATQNVCLSSVCLLCNGPVDSNGPGDDSCEVGDPLKFGHYEIVRSSKLSKLKLL